MSSSPVFKKFRKEATALLARLVKLIPRASIRKPESGTNMKRTPQLCQLTAFLLAASATAMTYNIPAACFTCGWSDAIFD
jgi:hypothetical protein